MNDQRDHRGSEAGAGSSEAGRKSDSMFIQNGREHHSFPIWKVASALLALPLGSAFVGGILAYKSAFTDVSEMVRDQARDAKYDNNTSIGQKISAVDQNQIKMQQDITTCKKATNFLLCWINKDKNKSCQLEIP